MSKQLTGFQPSGNIIQINKYRDNNNATVNIQRLGNKSPSKQEWTHKVHAYKTILCIFR